MRTFEIPGRFTPPPRLMKTLVVLAVAGGTIALIGVYLAPARAWPNLLLADYYGLSLALGAALFVALQYVSNAGWSVALRRVPEAIASTLPWFGAAALLLFYGIPHLYEWNHPTVVAGDAILRSKAGWLNTSFFIIRFLLCFGAWWFISSRMVRFSRHQDSDGELDLLGRAKRYSAAFIVVFAFTFSIVSFDWIMSLEPHWYSTIFAVYNFAGLFLNSLAAMTLVAIVLKRMGPFRQIVTSEHLHNLGKLIFAFSTFWMYIWFSQYLLIWYANIPEEVVYFVRRQEGSWAIFTVVNVIFNWVIPFVVLLPQWTKKSETILMRVCIILMIGHWIDLFWMILPQFARGSASFGIWEIAPMVAALSLFFIITFRFLSRGNVVPVRDPMLVESLQYHG